MAPGLMDAKDTPRIRALMAQLQAVTVHVESEEELSAAIERLIPSDLDVRSTNGAVGFIHRHLPDAEVYFIANTSAERKTFPLRSSSEYSAAEWWNPESGTVTLAMKDEPIALEPYGARILILHPGTASATPPVSLQEEGAPVVLSQWTAEFPGSAGSPHFASQKNASTAWTENPSTKFYSGEVRYETSVALTSAKAGEHLVLRFAEGQALPDTQTLGKNGIRAWYDAPIREAAVVFVNGKRAGSLWHPPYELDVTGFVRAGENRIEIHVYNTAINELAGQPPRDYAALKAKYGDRFQMQDIDNLQPVPSGIFGPVRMVREVEIH